MCTSATRRVFALGLVAAFAGAGAGRASADGGAPVNTAAPVISGILRAGQVLMVSSGWTGTEPIYYTYQWQRCDASGANCAGIAGAAGQSYVLAAADVAATIRVLVTATNPGGSTSAFSSLTALVAAPPAGPTSRVAPSLTGSAVVGSTLAVGNGVWVGDLPIAYVYQWQRCTRSGVCQDIPQATAASYKLVAADSGRQVRARVNATNTVSSDNALSNTSDIVTGGPNAPVNTALPVIGGNAGIGQPLNVSTGTWRGAAPPFTFLFQWQRCNESGSSCADIAGATAKSYTPVSGDSGKRLGALVTALTSDGAERIRSSLSEIVAGTPTTPANTRPPVVSGLVEVGQTLNATSGSWTGTEPLAYTYRWRRCTGPATCADIPSASGRAYLLDAGDRGATVQVVVTATNAAGSMSATSARSAVVATTVSSAEIVLGNGLTSVPASALTAPDRLLIDRVQTMRSRGSFTVRFRVSDLMGRVVRDALVYVLALPAGTIAREPELPTGLDGWVSFRLIPTARLTLQGGSLTLFVRARKQGEDLRAGISNRRLVQVRLGVGR